MTSLPVTEMVSAYIALAIGYNLVSMLLEQITGRRAANTDPMTGLLFVTVLYLTVAVGPALSKGLYLFTLSVFTVLVLLVGVIKHLLNYSESAYYSRFTWAAAILINVFGCVALVIVITSGP